MACAPAKSTSYPHSNVRWSRTVHVRWCRWRPAPARPSPPALSYRLLAHAGFKRILFLADRANLVRQTRDEYLAYRPPGTALNLPTS
jgi:hypothetical protein